MSFLDFSQKIGNSIFPRPKKAIVLEDKYVLSAELSYPSFRPNWLTCGAMAIEFGRVALPIGFDSVSIEEQREVAAMLAGVHFKRFRGALPYQAIIKGYRLSKNDKTILTMTSSSLMAVS